MSDSKAESESKIPLLGDIPVLGNLFKRKTKQNSNTELLIFLTPHIIPFPSQMAKLTVDESKKTPTAKAFTEEELNKYLDKVPPVDRKSKDGKGSKKSHDDDSFAPPH
jgi:type II secretory pathway component GspD/PulD (secretin)